MKIDDFGVTCTTCPNNSSIGSSYLSGLNSGSSYDVYVQAECGAGDTSSFAGPLTFTTSSQCSSPSGLVLSLIHISEPTRPY